MASTGARRKPQKYPVELRERAVKMVLEIREQTGERHGAVTRVAKELGIGTESLRGWVNRAEIDSGRRPGTSIADAQRIAQLEREVRELRRANDILKRGVGFLRDRARRSSEEVVAFIDAHRHAYRTDARVRVRRSIGCRRPGGEPSGRSPSVPTRCPHQRAPSEGVFRGLW